MKFLLLCVYCMFCLVCVFVILTRNIIYGADCNGSVSYMKRSNFAPQDLDLVLLYNGTEPGITEECFNRCANSTNDCQAFLVDYDASSCFRINTTTHDNDTIVRPNNNAVTSQKHVNFFQKTCLSVPLLAACRDKLWTFEVTVGSHLVGHDQKTVFDITGHEQCIQLCLYETTFTCRSANFYRGAEVHLLGICVMSSEDRRTKPDSYSPTPEDVVYLENQCVPPVGDACAMNEFQNTALPSFVDVYRTGLTLEQCESLCLNKVSFACRSFTYNPPGQSTAVSDRSSDRSYTSSRQALFDTSSDRSDTSSRQAVSSSSTTRSALSDTSSDTSDRSSDRSDTSSRQAVSLSSQCSLHSEDTTSLGSDAILSRTGTVYRERAACLNLLVTCSSVVMNVTLRTTEPFFGRVYSSGFSDTCNTDGFGSNVTSLSLPLEAGLPSQQCGVQVVRNIGSNTLSRVASVTLVIQYNAIIQRLGDRVVKVNCFIDDTKPPDQRLEKNITFNKNNTDFGTVNFTVNATRIVPRVRIRIVDLATGDADTNQTVVGKPLQLRLDPDTAEGDFDFTANSLLATNADGSTSFLLLDSRGCPANPQFFPGLFRDEVTNSYISDFSAFKFPNSRVVRFQLQLQYCTGQCQQVDCGNVPVRQRRHDLHQSDLEPASFNQSNLAYLEGRTSKKTTENETVFSNRSEMIPLEFALVVLPDPFNVEPHILGRTVVEETGRKVTNDTPNIISINADEYMCVPYVTSLGILMGWIILQFLVFFLCACFVRRQLRKQDDELRGKLIEDFGAFDHYNKRVRWADNIEAIAL